MNKLLTILISISLFLTSSCQMGQNRPSKNKQPVKERIVPPTFDADSAYKFIADQVNLALVYPEVKLIVNVQHGLKIYYLNFWCQKVTIQKFLKPEPMIM